MEHPLEEGRIGSQERVSVCLVSNIFSPDTVLLGCQRQCDEVSRLEVACHVCGRKNAADTTEVNIFEAEQGVLLIGSRVFTGAEEEEVGDDNHISLLHEDGAADAVGILEIWQRTWRGMGLN